MHPILQNANQRGMSALKLGSHDTASPFLQWVTRMFWRWWPTCIFLDCEQGSLTGLKTPMAMIFPVLNQECQGLTATPDVFRYHLAPLARLSQSPMKIFSSAGMSSHLGQGNFLLEGLSFSFFIFF